MNKIENWTWQLPSSEGKYLMCYGDVETFDNLSFIEVEEIAGAMCIRHKNGFLLSDKDPVPISMYDRKPYKFAKLNF